MRNIRETKNWIDPYDTSGGAVNFVFATHSDSNVNRMVRAVESFNPDIIAVELADQSTENRDDISCRMTMLLDGQQRVWTRDLSDFETEIVRRFRGMHTHYHTLDIATDDVAYEGLRKEDALATQYGAIPDENDTETILTRKKIASQFIEQASRNDAVREAVMANQLTNIFDDNPQSRIVAVLGATHTNVSRLMRPSIPTHRIFSPEIDEEAQYHPNEVMRFNPLEIAIRSLRLTGQTIDDIIDEAVDEHGYLKEDI